MNNEEKILEILTAMQSDIAGLKQDVQRLDTKIDKVESIAQATHDNLARFENDYKFDRGGLFDSLELLKDKTNRIETKLTKNENRLNNHELHIRALERPVW